MFKFLKPALLAAALLFAQPVFASDWPVLEHAPLLQDTDTDSHTYTHILELEPIPAEAYQTAKSIFLPDSAESIFGNYRNLDKNYNTGDCKDKATLFSVKTCTYPRAVTASSKCPFVPGYYKECACMPQFKVSSCPSPKYVSSPQCDGKGERCLCPSSVSLSYPNDRCTSYCDGACVAKSCSPTPSETGCQYGTTSVSDGCGGTRKVCKPCSPLSDQTGCKYGTYSCSNGCGGTRKCCSSCSPYSNETGCQYGTYSCSNGCGGTRQCCSSCTPASDETGCKYGTYSCSNGCGGTRKCCSGCSPAADETGCQYGTYSCSNGCGGTRKCCSGCTPQSNETGCQYGTESCSNGCGGTRTCCKAKPACTPYANQTGCKYGTQSCSDGCGGTRTCCKSACDGFSCPTWASCSETTSGPRCTCQSGFIPQPQNGVCVCRTEHSYFSCSYDIILKEDYYNYCGGGAQIISQSPCAYCVKCR